MGLSCRAAGARFGVSASTAIKWVQRWRSTGEVGARAMGGDRRSKLEAHAGFIFDLIEAQADLSLEEIRRALGETGVEVGRSSVGRFFERRRISFKKRRRTPRNKTVPAGTGFPPSAERLSSSPRSFTPSRRPSSPASSPASGTARR